jgi:hypothetical protein
VVVDVIERLRLGDFVTRMLGSMSGGERQRAVLARALAQQAPVLLLDEPTSALDIGHQQQALELVTELREHSGLTVVSAMHDLTLAGTYTDRLVLLDGGAVVANGSASEVLTAERLGEVFHVCVTVDIDPDDGAVIVVPRRGFPLTLLTRVRPAQPRLRADSDGPVHPECNTNVRWVYAGVVDSEPSESPYPTFPGVEPFDAVRTPEAERVHRKRMCALGYRIFGAMRWGQLGDGHVSARDPILTDHFWLLDWGVPFREGDRRPTRPRRARRSGDRHRRQPDRCGQHRRLQHPRPDPRCPPRRRQCGAHAHLLRDAVVGERRNPSGRSARSRAHSSSTRRSSTTRRSRCCPTTAASESRRRSATRSSASCATTARSPSVARWRRRSAGS